MQKWVFVLALVILVLRLISSGEKYQEGERIRLSAFVSQEPSLSEYSQTVVLQNTKVVLPTSPRVTYGDYLEVEGVFKDDRVQDASLLAKRENNFFFFAMRKKIVDNFAHALPIPHSSLVSGMVLGSKSSLPSEWKDRLRVTGTSHVVVASGMNVSLVGGFLLASLLKVTKRRKAIIFSLLFIWSYVAVAGFEGPLTRAALMMSVVFLCQLIGRVVNIFKVLTLVALVMLIINPNWLGDIGFQLSFAATLSLVLFESKVASSIRFVPEILKEGLSTSLAASILTSPILFLNFGTISLIGPIVNALVLWTVPYVTIGGMIAGLVGLINSQFTDIILFVLYPLTWWFWSVISIFS